MCRDRGRKEEIKRRDRERYTPEKTRARQEDIERMREIERGS